MKHEYVDFHTVESRHHFIHGRLVNWMRWVKVRKEAGWPMQPMWRNVKSNSWQWHTPEFRETCDMLDAMLLEETIRKLPHQHRMVIRWAYVYGGDPKGFARKLGMTTRRMFDILCEARTKVEYLLTNREFTDINPPNLARA